VSRTVTENEPFAVTPSALVTPPRNRRRAELERRTALRRAVDRVGGMGSVPSRPEATYVTRPRRRARSPRRPCRQAVGGVGTAVRHGPTRASQVSRRRCRPRRSRERANECARRRDSRGSAATRTGRMRHRRSCTRSSRPGSDGPVTRRRRSTRATTAAGAEVIVGLRRGSVDSNQDRRLR
jgi:hypothetical protein